MTPAFFQMVDSGQQFTKERWAVAMGNPSYGSLSISDFCRITAIPRDRVYEPNDSTDSDGTPDRNHPGGQERP